MAAANNSRPSRKQSSAHTALAYIGLGSNLGERLQHLQKAAAAIAALPGTQLLRASSLYSSIAAEGAAGSGDFYNAVLEISTALDPYALLDALQAIELAGGRLRPYHHAPRTVDLDILVFGDVCISDADRLSIPHPRIWQRDFVYKPLLELKPELANHPQKNDASVNYSRIDRPIWLKTDAL